VFAGAFLYGVTHDLSPEKSARGAAYLSQKVITQVGARLHSGTREYWEECLNSNLSD
jgi:sugar/nucleoside kinase (ribokinase family)